MRICLGTINICNIFTYLEDGFNQLGIKTIRIHSNKHRFMYKNNEKFYIRILQYFNSKLNAKNICLKIFWNIITEIYSFIILIYCMLKCDVFIFSFGTSFLRNNFDLPILKFFNKKIIMLYLGSDSRAPFMAGNKRNLTISEIITLTDKMYKKIAKVECYVDHIINYPPQALLQNRKFIMGLIVGLPFSTFEKNNINNENIKKNENVVILHSPSSPIDKGTNIIRKIISDLKIAGYKIEYRELIDKPHNEVIKNIKECDFVIDQLFSDTPMAVFSTEAAYYGKPSIVGGYYSLFLKNDIHENVIPPTEYVKPDDLKSAIIKFITDKYYRELKGRESQLYVSNYCSPKKVAERYLKIINNEIPDYWLYDPSKINYFYGYGYLEKEVKNRIFNFLKYSKANNIKLPLKNSKIDELFKFSKIT